MRDEHEVWAEALLIERQHGDAAPELIAARVRDLALEGDSGGVMRWVEIASCYDQLCDDAGVRH